MRVGNHRKADRTEEAVIHVLEFEKELTRLRSVLSEPLNVPDRHIGATSLSALYKAFSEWLINVKAREKIRLGTEPITENANLEPFVRSEHVK